MRMVRVFVATSLIALLGGCTAAQFDTWKQTHTPAALMDQGAKIGGAALTAAATGNPLPLIFQGFQSVGWLFGVGSAAVAVHQKRKFTKATTWDHQTER